MKSRELPKILEYPKTASLWRASAPDDVREAHRSGRAADGWDVWLCHLERRAEPVALQELLESKTPPLGWALPGGFDSGIFHNLLSAGRSRMFKGRGAAFSWSMNLLAWLGLSGGPSFNVPYALESLAWSHSLPQMARSVTPISWWTMLDHLLAVALRCPAELRESDPLAHQLLAAELGLTLGYLFPEIDLFPQVLPQVRKALAAGPAGVLDEQGLPRATRLGLFLPLVASLTRCRAMARAASDEIWDERADKWYRSMVRSALRLARPDGAMVFSQGPAGSWHSDLFAAAVRLSGDDSDRDIAAVALPKRRGAGPRKIVKEGLPEAAANSEEAKLAVLRLGWDRNGPRVTVTYPGQSVRMELSTGGRLVWSGVWELEVRRDGRPTSRPERWEEVCWMSDESVDYLELEAALGNGLRVQRHLVLARDDRFLLLADALLADRPARLEYRSVLPLVPDVSFEPAGETREGSLAEKDRLALVLPLALPEWRTDPRVGSLDQTERGLELHQTAEGRALFAPLFLDLQPKRFERQRTWRQLTVAENLAALPPDAAVGYRVMVDDDQWLIYRSLGPTGNRTLLGHNLVSEFLVAAFDSGDVDALLEIEGDTDVG